jgi:hypothetical protein
LFQVSRKKEFVKLRRGSESMHKFSARREEAENLLSPIIWSMSVMGAWDIFLNLKLRRCISSRDPMVMLSRDPKVKTFRFQKSFVEGRNDKRSRRSYHTH